MIEALKIAKEILTLAPLLRPAVSNIVSALRSGTDADVRAATEAALRLSFVARQVKR